MRNAGRSDEPPSRAASVVFRRASILGLLLCVVLLVSGVFLRWFYTPDAAKPYADIQSLRTTVSFGLLVRNGHRWSGYLLIAVLAVVVLAALARAGNVRDSTVVVCLVGAVLLLARPWIVEKVFGDAVIGWTGLEGSKLTGRSIRWYGAHPLAIVGPVVAFAGGLAFETSRFQRKRRTTDG